MSVAGFDIGNENCVIAVAKQRGIDVLLNDESNRETPAVVSFGEKQRFMGSSGAALAAMQPKSTISQIKRLIGHQFNEPIVQADLRLLPFEASKGPDDGILIHLHYLNKKQTFTPIQILAMLLSHLKQVTEKNIKTSISEIVIGIPSYFTDLQRRSYIQAAEIAGLKTLRLMHDCTATALGYGIYKTDIPRKGLINVVFVDIGHSDTQVAVVSFSHGHMKVLSHAFDRDLGGRDFDEVLFKYFASQFKEEYNIDVYSNARASIRLRASCEKLKKVLSANPEAPLSIECLIDEKDVKGYIKREDFEKLSYELLDRIAVPCHQAMYSSGLRMEMIHSVELVGSGSRVPAITKILRTVFSKEPRRTLNASECVAFGCALQCAMLSPTFRVKNYEVQDCLPFSVGLKRQGSTLADKDSIFFPKGNLFPCSKMFALHKNDVIHMDVFYPNLNELPSGMYRGISYFKIKPFRVSHAEKAKIKTQINVHGIATLQCTSLIEDPFDDSSLNSTYDNVQGHVRRNSHSHINFGEANGSANQEMRRLEATRRQQLTVHEYIYGGLTLDGLSKAKKIELELAQQDIIMERTKDKKNTLESYVYETRNKLLNTYRSFATDSETEEISHALKQTEEWLYADGDDVPEIVYTKRLEDLEKMIDPIERRYKDEEARELASQHLLKSIHYYWMAKEKLPCMERDAVNDECVEANRWLREKTEQQNLRPKNADPILWSGEIILKYEALTRVYEHMASLKFSSANQEDAIEADTQGTQDTHDTQGTQDTHDTQGTQDTHDTQGTQDTHDTHDTQDTQGTHDTQGKSDDMQLG